MAQKDSRKLDNGDPFPQITIELLDNGKKIIPDDFDGDFAVMLFYRGDW